MPLNVSIRHLQEKELHIQGELPAPDLELSDDDELVRAGQPLQYDLTVRLADKDILVSGRLEMTLDCECARCLKPFGFPLNIPDWLLHLPGEGPDKPTLHDDLVDLTPYLREAILLEFPQHPLCQNDCQGLPKRADSGSQKTNDAGQTPQASAWAALNKLKF
jgi:uncharacterized protein